MAFRTTANPREDSKETVNKNFDSDSLSREPSKHTISTSTCASIQPDTSISTPNRSKKRKSMTTELKKEESREKDELEINNISSFSFPDIQMLLPSIPMIGTQNSMGLPNYFHSQSKLQTMEDNDSENGETKRGKSPFDGGILKLGSLFSPISTFASQSSEAYPQFYNSHNPSTQSNNIAQSFSQFSEYNAMQNFPFAIGSFNIGNNVPIDHEASLYRVAVSQSNDHNSFNIHQNSQQPNNIGDCYSYHDIIPEDDFHIPGVQDVNEDLDPIVPINSNRHNSVTSVKKPDTSQLTGNYNRIRAQSYESNVTNSSSRGKILQAPSSEDRKAAEGKRRSKRSAAMRRRVSTSETEELTESFGFSDDEYMSDASGHDRSFTKRQRSNTIATGMSNSNEMLAEVLEQSGIDSKKPNKRVYIVRKNIDPENLKKIDAIRKEDKRRKNRELAAKSRTKKKARMDYLEQEVRDLVSQNKGLKSEVTVLKRKVDQCTCQHINRSANP